MHACHLNFLVATPRLVVLSMAIMLLGSCTSFRLIRMTMKTDLSAESTPQITESQNCRTRLAECRNVVISLPKLINQQGTKSGDEGITNSQVLVGGYSTWLTEIERVFVKKNYTVLSREKYDELVREAQTAPSVKAAELIGADLIIQINALEYNPAVSIAQRTTIELEFFESDARATAIKPAELGESDVLVMSDRIARLADAQYEPFAYMALLDCKLIDAKSGKILMFYRNKEFVLRQGRESEVSEEFLFRVEKPVWIQVTPKTDAVKKKDPVKVTTTTINREAGGRRKLDPVIRLELVRLICNDLITRLPKVNQP